MQSDDMYAEVAKPEFYRLFHEVVSLPTTREFFSWDQGTNTFTIEEKARQLFELIAPLEEDSTAKLSTFRDARNLRYIIGDSTAEAILFDPEQPLAAALALALPDPTPKPTSLPTDIKNCFKSLEDAQIEELVALDSDDVNLLEDLADLIASRLDQYRRLAA